MYQPVFTYQTHTHTLYRNLHACSQLCGGNPSRSLFQHAESRHGLTLWLRNIGQKDPRTTVPTWLWVKTSYPNPESRPKSLREGVF